jgi:hypothetical protein
MKRKTNVPAVTLLGGALLLCLGGAGCAASGDHARLDHATQCRAGGDSSNFKASLAQHQSWAFPAGSVVSPLGDAPGERDLELTREWPAEHPVQLAVQPQGLVAETQP